MMDRRRALMMQAGGASNLIYSLYNQTVTDGAYIQTGVTPFIAGMSFTILMDINITSNPGSTDGAYRYRLLFCYDEAYFSIRKPSQYNAGIRARFNNTADADNIGKIGTSAKGRKRIVVTHTAGSNSMRVICKDQTGTTTDKTLSTTSAFTPRSSELVMGSNIASYGLPPAVINKVQVYNIVLDQAEIDAFLA